MIFGPGGHALDSKKLFKEDHKSFLENTVLGNINILEIGSYLWKGRVPTNREDPFNIF